MSLSIDGVWKTGVWAQTVWADGVWFEGAYAPPTQIVTSAAGGGIRHRPQQLVIIGRKKYRVDSYDQLTKLLRDYLKEQQAKLDAEQTQKIVKNRKVIKILKKIVSKTEVRLAKAHDEWRNQIEQIDQIDQENENIILLMEA